VKIDRNDRGQYVVTDTVQRFWSKVDRRESKVDRREPDECWPWLGTVERNGYGRFWLYGRNQNAHRVAYLLTYGKLDPTLVIDHVRARGCYLTHCVNPAHLEQTTPRENVLRGHASVTHCPDGHPYEGRNLYINKRGARICRTCQATAQRAYTARKRAERCA
jgi:HNH endonuclease